MLAQRSLPGLRSSYPPIGAGDADHLLLRGYILLPVFGQTQTWTRHAGPLGADCAMPE